MTTEKDIIEEALKEYDSLIKKTKDEVSLRFLNKVTKVIYKAIQKAIQSQKQDETEFIRLLKEDLNEYVEGERDMCNCESCIIKRNFALKIDKLAKEKSIGEK